MVNDDETKPIVFKIISLMIKFGPLTPMELSEKLRRHKGSISRDLQTMKEEKWIKFIRDGTKIHYYVDQKKWDKHVEKMLSASVKNLSDNLEKQNDHKDIEEGRKINMITIESDHLDFNEFKRLIGEPEVGRIFRILDKSMNIKDMHKNSTVPITIFCNTIDALEGLNLLQNMGGNLVRLDSDPIFEKTFEVIRVVIQNMGDSIEIISKPEYFDKIYDRFYKK